MTINYKNFAEEMEVQKQRVNCRLKQISAYFDPTAHYCEVEVFSLRSQATSPASRIDYKSATYSQFSVISPSLRLQLPCSGTDFKTMVSFNNLCTLRRNWDKIEA